MLVSRRFPPDELGGVEQYTYSLAAELAQRGDSVSIVARRSGRAPNGVQIFRERLPDGSSLFRLVAGGYNSARSLDGQVQVEQLFRMALIESAPEVVHINHLMGFSPRAIQLAHRLGAAVVVSLHDFYFACPRVHLQKPTGELCKGPALGSECATVCFANGSQGDRLYWGIRAMWFQRSLAMAERVIAYSQYVAGYFRPMCTGAPIEVIENGIPSKGVWDDTRPVHNSGGCLTLAYCGTVAPHKGPHMILEALRLAKLERVRLLLIGQTPERAYAAALREKASGIPGLALQMYGEYSRNELPVLLRGVDCVIVPSLVPEAGPIVPREALGLGIPVVASNLGALPELIVEGENGFTFNPFHTAELAAILRRLTSDAELLPRLRAGARRSPMITLATHAERVRAVYQAAIEEFKSRPADRPGTCEFEFLYSALAERERDLAQASGLNATRAASIGG